MGRCGFGAARTDEAIVYGAQRPGYPDKLVDSSCVTEWISFMQQSGVQRICCLLPRTQLGYYSVDLLRMYREAFGESEVCHAEIDDYHLCDPIVLKGKILPFIFQSLQTRAPVVVHCSGGSGRTGHVLAAWLVHHRGLSVDDALDTVISSGRNPWEAVQCGNATEEQLRSLLAGRSSQRAG